MAYIRQFGCYLPERVVDNLEISALIGREAEWIFSASGIEERRFARFDETVAGMAVRAARDCMERAGVSPREIGFLIVSSGSSERRFPGPAAEAAHQLELGETPAIDIPMASAGSLFGLALAERLAPDYGNILVVAAEKMSVVALKEPLDAGTTMLFGDGAGACLVSSAGGRARIADCSLGSDGTFTGDLRLEFDAPVAMNGRSVIMQASRKIPRSIRKLLDKNGVPAPSVGAFLMHQANQNLINRVAQSIDVPPDRFYTNIRRYGNTSSASLLIAAAEWDAENGFRKDIPVVFAAFGAGFHWGALLAVGT